MIFFLHTIIKKLRLEMAQRIGKSQMNRKLRSKFVNVIRAPVAIVCDCCAGARIMCQTLKGGTRETPLETPRETPHRPGIPENITRDTIGDITRDTMGDITGDTMRDITGDMGDPRISALDQA